MYAPAYGVEIDAGLAPFVRADDAQQFAQRHYIRLIRRTKRLMARKLHIGRAPQWYHMAGIERDQQHAQRARTLGLCLAMQMKCLRECHSIGFA